MWMSFSPDGIHWDNCAENPVIPLGSDTTQSLVWDETIESYVAFGRMGANGRRVARASSRDAVHFDEPTMVFDADQWDEEGTQFSPPWGPAPLRAAPPQQQDRQHFVTRISAMLRFMKITNILKKTAL